ncbi:MAG: hypothetical protein ACLP8S_05580 [Solirubrobacteraceae bacterium]
MTRPAAARPSEHGPRAADPAPAVELARRALLDPGSLAAIASALAHHQADRPRTGES